MIIGVPCSSTSTMMLGTEGANPKARSARSFFRCAAAESTTATANPASATIKIFDKGNAMLPTFIPDGFRRKWGSIKMWGMTARNAIAFQSARPGAFQRAVTEFLLFPYCSRRSHRAAAPEMRNLQSRSQSATAHTRTSVPRRVVVHTRSHTSARWRARA
jgi:hypothetical protein